MNSQPVRWPADSSSPRLIAGGCDVADWGSRYLFVGPVVFTVDHEFGRWVFRVMWRFGHTFEVRW